MKPDMKSILLFFLMTVSLGSMLACEPSHKSYEKSPEEINSLQSYLDNPETIDYSVIEEHIVQPHCFRCHSQDSPSVDDEAVFYADLTSYKDLVNPFLPVLIKGDPKDSSIYKAIAVDSSMPPPPNAPLTLSLTELMRLWILNCAIETYDPNEDLSPVDSEKIRNCEEG